MDGDLHVDNVACRKEETLVDIGRQCRVVLASGAAGILGDHLAADGTRIGVTERLERIIKCRGDLGAAGRVVLEVVDERKIVVDSARGLNVAKDIVTVGGKGKVAEAVKVGVVSVR